MRRHAAALVIAAAAAGCAAGANGTRVETFRVDEHRRAFTLVIEETGRPPLKIAGDAKGTAIGEAERRELLRYLDAHIERLGGVKETAADVKWMKAFRAAYAKP